MKTAEEIYEEMLETFAEKTSYNISDSSDLAVRLYASAAQISALYAQIDYVEKAMLSADCVGNIPRLSRRDARNRAHGGDKGHGNNPLRALCGA